MTLRSPLALSAALAGLLASCAGGEPDAVSTAPSSSRRTSAYYDAYQEAPAVAQVTAAPAKGTVASVDAKRGTPRFLWASQGELPPASVVASNKARGGSPAAAAALWHLEQHAAAYGLSPEALGSVEVALVHDTGRGAITVRLRQRVGGVEVYRTQMGVLLNRDYSLIALTGDLHPAARSTKTAPGPFRLTEADAIRSAIADVTGDGPDFLAPAGLRGGYLFYGGSGLSRPARAKKILFALPDRLVPAYLADTSVKEASGTHGFLHVFAADDGRLLYRQSIDDDAAFQYRVWADTAGAHKPADGPIADSTPHPTGNPDGYTPGYTTPSLISIDGFNHPPGGGPGDPWLPDSATVTTGNNVDAYADINDPDGFTPGDLRATTTGTRTFDRTYNTAQAPNSSPDQIMASVAHLFYVNNWLHDFYYDSGFNEVAGNAQSNNFGRGGVGGDPIHAEAQDASGTDNANMQTPPDGVSPTMQMYRFLGNGLHLDGTIDNLIVAHEWGHYLHHRLVECGGSSCGAMSEGWGDFVALSMAISEGDDLNRVYPMSAYATQTIYENAAYFGIRRYPYSNDHQKSPLTFRYVRNGVTLPPGIPVNTLFAGNPNWESHNAGEIWCAILFEGLGDLIGQSRGPTPRYSFDQAKRRMADYIVAGMIAAPVEPNFVEQRDAILGAAAAADPQDFILLATAFARRGFGSGAIAPPAGSADGSPVTENYQVTGVMTFDGITIDDSAHSCDDDGILDVGEVGRVTVRIKNTGAAALTNTRVKVTSQTTGVQTPDGDTAMFAATQPFQTATATVNIRLDESGSVPNKIRLQLQLTDSTAALASVTATAEATVNRDVHDDSSRTDDVESPRPVWTSPGTAWERKVSTQGGSTVWFIPDIAVPADETLVSPPIRVAATGNFTLSWRQRFSFEFSGGLNFDGGVVEVSTDDGVTWNDISMFGNPGYNGMLAGGGLNPLQGRNAYVQTSSGYPAFSSATANLGTSLAGRTIRVRFRLGTDLNTGADGWELDDITVAGTDNTPFPTTSTDAGTCLVGQRPIANAGTDLTVFSGQLVTLDGTLSSDPENTALTYQWSQATGVVVQLQDARTAHASFTAPTVTQIRTLEFRLIVTDTDNRVSLPDSVRVTIMPGQPDAGMPDAGVDAGVDAGPPDGPGPDAAGPDAAGPDAGEPLPPEDDGCCSTSNRNAPSSVLLALGLAAALGRRRRRRE